MTDISDERWARLRVYPHLTREDEVLALLDAHAERDELLAAILRLPEDPDGDGPDERVGLVLADRARLKARVEGLETTALREVLAERDAQRRNWGDEHDDEHTRKEWIGLIQDYAERIPHCLGREGLVKVAALCLAAMEAEDRADAEYAALADQPAREET